MSKISDELKKKKKNVRRSRQGNTMKQAEEHNPDGSTRYNKVVGKAQKYYTHEHITNDSRIEID